jgi:hypothetical protein
MWFYHWNDLSSHFPEKFREIYNFAFGWAKEKVNTVLHNECAWICAWRQLLFFASGILDMLDNLPLILKICVQQFKQLPVCGINQARYQI